MLKKSALLLAFDLILVFSSVFFILANMHTRRELEESKRGFYSEGASYLVCEETVDRETLRGILSGEEWMPGALFKKDLEMDADTRGIFYSGKIEIPPLLSGRFFTPEESRGNERKALIGARFRKDLYQEDGKQYIEILGEPFEVIGILGSAQPTRLDNMKWIPLETAVELTGISGRYAADGISETAVENNTKLLRTVMEEDWTMRKTGGQNSLQGLHKWGDLDIIEKIYLSIVCVFVLNMILAGNYWMRRKNQKVQVEKLLGLSAVSVICSIYSDFLAVAGTSFLIVGAAAVCLTLFRLVGAIDILEYCLCCGFFLLAEMLIIGVRLAIYILRTRIVPKRM